MQEYDAVYHKAYYEKNKTRILARQRKYYKRNKKKICAKILASYYKKKAESKLQ